MRIKIVLFLFLLSICANAQYLRYKGLLNYTKTDEAVYTPIDANVTGLFQATVETTMVSTEVDQWGNIVDTKYFDALAADRPVFASGGISFDGINDYMVLNSDAFDMGTGDLTVELYLKTPATFATTHIFLDHRQNFTLNGWSIFANGTGNFRAIICDATHIQFSGSALSTSTNYLLSVVFDRDGNLQAYINGVAETPLSISSKSASNITTALMPTLFAQAFNTGARNSGIIYEIRISDKVRTQAEVQAYYNYVAAKY